jgi:23S rRNA pseudouridine1911/1915/1917 synthase
LQATSSDGGETLHVTVEGDEGSPRLDRVLAVACANLSRSRLKALILAGSVTVKGAPVRDPAYHVTRGDTITIDVPEAAPPEPKAEDIALNIVFEDDDIIVIDKPKGLVVHPAAGHETGTLVNALIAHCGDSLSGIGGERRPGIVHRLDKDTTGLMVVAKNDRAHQALAAQFADHGRSDGSFERGYLAFVWGAPDRPHGTIARPIDRDPRARDRMTVREGGRDAVTYWQVLERYPAVKAERPRSKLKEAKSSAIAASLLACRLETGRTHQIRVHLGSIGHPLLGDPVYGSGFRTKAALLSQAAQSALATLGRQALHAHILRINHPLTGEMLGFRSELPADLARLHDALAGSRAGTGGE